MNLSLTIKITNSIIISILLSISCFLHYQIITKYDPDDPSTSKKVLIKILVAQLLLLGMMITYMGIIVNAVPPISIGL